MDFAFSPEQVELHQRALAFTRQRLQGGAIGTFDRERWQLLGDFGFLGLCVPKALGGLGLDALTTARVSEALGEGQPDLGLAFAAMAHLYACVMPIVEHGSPAQHQALVPGLASGALVGANAITEAGAGSDVFSLTTKGVRDGDGWVLDGEKSYVTNAPAADVFVVYAKTNPSHGYLGITAFVVRRGTPGLTIGQPFEKMGLGTAGIAPIYFEGLKLGDDARLGKPGQGAAIFNASMRWERTCLFACWLGAMDRLLAICVEHAKSRKQFGRPIGKNQAVAHALADWKLELESARLLMYRAAWALGRGGDVAAEVSMAKLAVSETAIRAGLHAITVHGGLGYVVEAGIERFLRDAVPTTIFSGSSAMHKDIIAHRLGL